MDFLMNIGGFKITSFDWLDVNWFPGNDLVSVLRAFVIAIIGIPVLYMITRYIPLIFRGRVSPHVMLILKKSIFYFGFLLLMSAIMVELGFNMTALLGAAGIISVAFGLAAQESLSNIVSGFSLFAEEPFQVGDLIKVNETIGFVLSIDLLSVKVRTFDNHYVRFPNAVLIRQEIRNISRFPIRRHDIFLKFSYLVDLKRVKEVLLEIAEANRYCLDEPEPLIIVLQIEDSRVEVQYGVWFEKSKFVEIKDTITQDIIDRFKEECIEISIPRVAVHIDDVPFKGQSEHFSHSRKRFHAPTQQPFI